MGNYGKRDFTIRTFLKEISKKILYVGILIKLMHICSNLIYFSLFEKIVKIFLFNLF